MERLVSSISIERRCIIDMHDYKEYHVMSVKDSLLCDRLSQISPSFCHTLYGNELIKVQAPFGSLHCGDTIRIPRSPREAVIPSLR